MTDIYDQHRAAFANVEAYVILKNGERVATVALKFPRGNAGRLWAYVHWIGTEMVRGYAGGGGYDKRSAALAHAARKMIGAGPLGTGTRSKAEVQFAHAAFIAACREDGGNTWDRCLRDAGFTVLQAV